MSYVPVVCRTFTVLMTLTACAVVAVGADPSSSTSPAKKSAGPPVKATSFGRLPLAFEKNTGRYDKRVKFLARTGGATVFLTANEMVMVLRSKARGDGQEASGPAVGAKEPQGRPIGARHSLGRNSFAHMPNVGEPPGAERSPLKASGDRTGASPLPPRSHVLRMKLVGANAKAVATGVQKQPGIVNYFIGNDPKKWRTRVPTYAKAKLAGVYPGIDVVYYGQGAIGKGQEGKAGALADLSPLASRLEYDFILKPGADPGRIRLAFEGADRIRVAGGDLILSTSAGDVRMRRPDAYQTVGGKRVQVACDYVLRQQTAALRIARYDASRPLVVDPVLEYSTFLGGSSDEFGNSIAVDASGAAYVTGYTTIMSDFPATTGAFDTTADGLFDAFVTKLNPSGSTLEYSTFVGGGHYDYGLGIAVDSSGAAYVTGYTESPDFPVTPGAFDPAFHCGFEAFVTKLNSSGSALEYSTFLGGDNYEEGCGIAVDSSGSAYVTGWTSSPDFPTTPGAFDTTCDGQITDAFVTKLNPSGSALEYSTFLGGDNYEEGCGIAVDSSGSAYVTGWTSSPDFPTTPGAFDITYHGSRDAFVTKLDPSGSALHYSTFLAGIHNDYGNAITVDSSGAAYVTGQTVSSDFPTTPGAFGTTHADYWDAFVTKLNPSGSVLDYSTFLGGSLDESGNGIAVDASGAAYVTGQTVSSDFPTTPDAFDTTCDGHITDAFVTKLNPSGSALEYSTFLGGSDSDEGRAIAVSSSGMAYVTGQTLSADFPTTPDAFDTTFGDYWDVFVVKVIHLESEATLLDTIDRIGTITDLTILRGYLSRASDGTKLDGKTVEFSIDGTPIGSAVTGATGSSGRADLNWIITDGPATRTILAEFAGDSAYAGSSDTATLTCQTWATKMSGVDRTGTFGNYRILKAWLWKLDNSPVPGKTIAFSLDGTYLGSDVTRPAGYAQLGHVIADGAGAGTRTILAQWAGDGGYLPSSCTNRLTVTKAAPYIWVMPRSIPYGGIARLYAYFRRLPDYQKQEGKTVTFRIDGTWIADVVTLSGTEAGIARYQYTTVEPRGAHTIRCEFAGDAWVDAGYGEASLTIY